MRIRSVFPLAAMPLIVTLQGCGSLLLPLLDDPRDLPESKRQVPQTQSVPQSPQSPKVIELQPQELGIKEPQTKIVSPLSAQSEERNAEVQNAALISYIVSRQMDALLSFDPDLEAAEPHDFNLHYLPEEYDAKKQAIEAWFKDYYSRIFTPGSAAERHAFSLHESGGIFVAADDFETLLHILEAHPVVSEMVNPEAFVRWSKDIIEESDEELSEDDERVLRIAVHEKFDTLQRMSLMLDLLVSFGNEREDARFARELSVFMDETMQKVLERAGFYFEERQNYLEQKQIQVLHSAVSIPSA